MCVLVILTGCVKEDDVLPPVVVYDLPLENSVYAVPDTIQVRADISSEEMLESVDVRIVDHNYTPSSESILNQVSAMSYELNEFLIIDDIYLESGEFFVEIIARSQNETKRKYQPIQINEYPRLFEKLAVVQEDGGIQFIGGISDTLQLENFSTAGANETDIAIVNNYHRQLVVGYSNGSLIAYSTESNSIVWETVQSNPIWSDYYKDAFIDEDDRTTYVSTSDGEILGFDQFGNNGSLINVGENNKAGQIYVDGDLVIAEVETQNGLERWIKVFSKYTGSLITTSASIGMDVKNILKVGEGEYLIAGDGAEQLVVYFRDGNGFFDPGSFEIGSISDVAITDDGNVIVAHSTGIYLYEPDTNALFNIGPYLDVIDIEYEESTGVLIMASEQLIRYYSVQTASIVNEIYIGDNVQEIDLIYNK
ncbi:MAG: hypothetical protein HKN39_07250 [Flavobacteriales bacterium]|nr:hypothetical protein [Flavobacteriales bacterium]